jgi:hypothetical protein
MAKSSQVILTEDQFYLIKARNGKVLEVANFNTENGAAIRLWDYAGHPWQQWRFIAAGDNCWRIQNRFTGKMIDLTYGGIEAGTWLHQWSRTSGQSQCWLLEPTNGGRIRIRNALAQKCIDLVAMSTANGTLAQIWDDVTGGNQEWDLERINVDLAQELPSANGAPARPQKTASQRKHQNDLVDKINRAGRGRNN